MTVQKEVIEIKEKIPVMTYSQYRRARKLVHQCCNYESGNCLALDDGEECVCVQSICMKNGEERGFTASEFRTAQNDGWEKQYPYKVGKKKVYMIPSAAEAQGLVRADKHPKSTRYGPATAGRIPSQNAGTAKISLPHGGRHGRMCPTVIWNVLDVRNALTTAATLPEDWMNSPPSTRE